MAVISLVARINAQATEFEKTFSKASQTVAQFEKQYGGLASSVAAHQTRINKAVQSFSGDKIIAEANEYASAVARVGGAAKLTESEQRRVNASVTEAIAKYQALGQTAPKALTDLLKATAQIPAVAVPAAKSIDLMGQRSGFASAAMGVLGSTLGKFTIAGLAVTAINNLTGAIAGFASKGTALGPLQQSFEKLTASVGQNSGEMLSKMQEATRGLVSNYDLMQTANKAVLLGLPATSAEMGDLAKTARILGKAMGLDATTALDNLVTALGRSSPLLLDNLGLAVKVGEANEKYAAALGKTADGLTDVESKSAFHKAAMEAARLKVKELGDQTETATERASSAWTFFGNHVTAVVAKANEDIGKYIDLLSNLERDLDNYGLRAVEAPTVTPPKLSVGAPPKELHDTTAALKLLEDGLDKQTEAAKKAADAAKRHSDAIQQIRDRLTGADLVGKVRDLSEAMQGLSSQRALSRVADEAGKLFASGAKLTPKMIELGIAFGTIGPKIEPVGKAFAGLGKTIAVVVPQLDKGMEALNRMDASTIKSLAAGVQNLAFVFSSLPGTLVPVRNMAQEASTALDKLRAKFYGVADGIKSFASGFDGIVARVISGAGTMVGQFGALVTAVGKMNVALAAIDFGVTIGNMLKPLLGLRSGKLGDLLGTNRMGRELVEDFAKSFDTFNLDTLKFDNKGFENLQKQLSGLGAEGEKLWVALTQGVGKSNPEQARAVIDAVNAALQRHKQALDQSATAATEAGKAEDAAFSGLRSRIDELGNEYTQLFKSIENEAPEEVMGVIESQTRARMASIKQEQTSLQSALEASLKSLEGAAKGAADAITEALSGIKVPPIVIETELRSKDIPELATGGIARRQTLDLVGEARPDVVPLSQFRGAAPSDQPLQNTIMLDGEVLLKGMTLAKRRVA